MSRFNCQARNSNQNVLQQDDSDGSEEEEQKDHQLQRPNLRNSDVAAENEDEDPMAWAGMNLSQSDGDDYEYNIGD